MAQSDGGTAGTPSSPSMFSNLASSDCREEPVEDFLPESYLQPLDMHAEEDDDNVDSQRTNDADNMLASPTASMPARGHIQRLRMQRLSRGTPLFPAVHHEVAFSLTTPRTGPACRIVIIPPVSTSARSLKHISSLDTPIPSKATSTVRSVLRRMDQSYDSDEKSSKAQIQGSAHLRPLDMLTIDIIMHIFGLLESDVLLICMSVSRKWRGLAGLREVWHMRKESNQATGIVNLAAFRRIRDLRCKPHSKVVQCQNRVTGEMMVVKRILTRANPSAGSGDLACCSLNLDNQGFPVRYLREVSLLRASNHPNVMRLHCVSYQDGRLDLFSEFVGQNVEDYIASLPSACFEKGTREHSAAMIQCRDITRQILNAVCYCHTRGILLRDIKPRNVMLDHSGSGQAKLTGFALGRFAPIPSEPLTREVVTLSYRAPEILLGGQDPKYSAPVDMWSVGCTLAEIASGVTLFEGESEIGLLFCIFRLLGTPTNDMWPGVTLLPDFLSEPPRWAPKDLSVAAPLCEKGLDLLGQLLRYDPARRISAKAALTHPFFTGESLGDVRSDSAHSCDSALREIEGSKANTHDAGRAGAGGSYDAHRSAASTEAHVPATAAPRTYEQEGSLDHVYEDDLRRALLMAEKLYLAHEDYKTNRQLRGFSAMRKILVEWLVEVVEEAKMKCETLFLAVNYLDRFLSRQEVEREKLQLVGITSILVASKHEDLAPQSVSNLVMMTDNTYNRSDVLAMERLLLHVLNYSLTALTPLRALELVRIRANKTRSFPPANTPQHLLEAYRDSVWWLAKFLVELALAEYAEVRTTPSCLSAAALMLAVHTLEVPRISQIPMDTNIGEGGPMLSAAAECVWDALGGTFSSHRDVDSAMQSIGATLYRLHQYHIRALPLFATCRKYSNPKRMSVSLLQCCATFMLPVRVLVHGVQVKLVDC